MGHQASKFDRNPLLYSATMVPTMATANAPQAPMPFKLTAPDVPVASAPLPWKVVPVTTWPLIVVVIVETPEDTALAAMVVLQSVHVPVNDSQGAPRGPPNPPGPPPGGPPGPPGPPVGHDPVLHDPVLHGPVLQPVHVDHEHGPQPPEPGPRYPKPGPPHGPLAQPGGAPGRADETAENHGAPPHDDHPDGQAEPPDVAEKVASGFAVTVTPALAQP